MSGNFSVGWNAFLDGKEETAARNEIVKAAMQHYDYLIEKYRTFGMAAAYCDSLDGFPLDLLRACHELKERKS